MPAGHRLDVGDAEGLVDARQHHDRAGRARARSASLVRQLAGELDARRPRAPRRAARAPARSGPSPMTRSAAGRRSRSIHSARMTSAWRLRATRCADVTTVSGSRGAATVLGHVGAEVHDAGLARAEVARAAGRCRPSWRARGARRSNDAAHAVASPWRGRGEEDVAAVDGDDERRADPRARARRRRRARRCARGRGRTSRARRMQRSAASDGRGPRAPARRSCARARRRDERDVVDRRCRRAVVRGGWRR